jgi:hypothetical protein
MDPYILFFPEQLEHEVVQVMVTINPFQVMLRVLYLIIRSSSQHQPNSGDSKGDAWDGLYERGVFTISFLNASPTLHVCFHLLTFYMHMRT